MLRLPPRFGERLEAILLAMDALDFHDNRTMLLHGLPSGPRASINRSQAKLTDLYTIVRTAESLGRILASGEWALALIARNALRFAQGTSPGAELEQLLAELEIGAPDTYSLLDEKIVEEALIGPRDERLSVAFLEGGLAATKAVAKLMVPYIVNGTHQQVMVGNTAQKGYTLGSGWLIAPGLLLTNYHVIKAREASEPQIDSADLQAQAQGTVAWFNYDRRPDTGQREHSEYRCVELVAFDAALDFALLRIGDQAVGGGMQPLAHWGYLAVPREPVALRQGDRLNIIQHPQGGPKQLAIRNNFYVDQPSTPDSPRRIRYLTDTEPGSSGSPVLSDNWRVVAIHSSAQQAQTSRRGGEVTRYANQGVLIKAIIDTLPRQLRSEIAKAQGWN